LVHCISANLEINNNIDKQFLNRFDCKRDLKSQKLFKGRCYTINTNKQIIFYLVTKIRHFDIATYETLENCLEHLYEVCTRMNIKAISISQESLEKDNLEWNSAKKVINKIFFKTNIQINVYKHLNKFKLFQTILQQNEQQLTSYFNPEHLLAGNNEK